MQALRLGDYRNRLSSERAIEKAPSGAFFVPEEKEMSGWIVWFVISKINDWKGCK